MNYMQRMPRHLSLQRGVALVIGLVMLLVITLIAVSGMNSSMMQERMAANAQNINRVFQAAESAVGAITGELTGGDTSTLQTALTAGESGKASFSVSDPDITASYQVIYQGEVAVATGSSMDGDSASTTLKAYRFGLRGVASIDSVKARKQITQGIEYH